MLSKEHFETHVIWFICRLVRASEGELKGTKRKESKLNPK